LLANRTWASRARSDSSAEVWDPPENHCHLGPIAVSPEIQGYGIGRQLMERHCSQLDARGIDGYLETDRVGNVEFYKRFGFEVTGTTTIHGVLNFFMLRKSKTTG
jgi:predicted N-acetyltransferase YhbS